jgi:tRNA U54 and U55 pseudouridine synthase Pus10
MSFFKSQKEDKEEIVESESKRNNYFQYLITSSKYISSKTGNILSNLVQQKINAKKKRRAKNKVAKKMRRTERRRVL